MTGARKLSPLLAVALALVACSDGPDPVSPSALTPLASSSCDGNVATVVLSPNSLSMLTEDESHISLFLYDSGGCVVSTSGKFVGWTSSNTSVAEVKFPSSSGTWVRAVSAGSATITATVDGRSGHASVTVEQKRLEKIVVTPNPGRTHIGGIVYFKAEGKDQRGGTMALGTVSWSVADPLIATINSVGEATGQSLGTTTVSATSEGVTGSATLDIVHQVVASGPQEMYEGAFTVTATPNPAGSYYYTWAHSTCTMNGSCDDTYYDLTAGWDVTSVQGYMSRHDINQKFRVQIRHSSSGSVLATGYHIVHGAGEPDPNGDCGTQITC